MSEKRAMIEDMKRMHNELGKMIKRYDTVVEIKFNLVPDSVRISRDIEIVPGIYFEPHSNTVHVLYGSDKESTITNLDDEKGRICQKVFSVIKSYASILMKNIYRDQNYSSGISDKGIIEYTFLDRWMNQFKVPLPLLLMIHDRLKIRNIKFGKKFHVGDDWVVNMVSSSELEINGNTIPMGMITGVGEYSIGEDILLFENNIVGLNSVIVWTAVASLKPEFTFSDISEQDMNVFESVTGIVLNGTKVFQKKN